MSSQAKKDELLETPLQRWLRERSEKAEGKKGPDIFLDSAVPAPDEETNNYFQCLPDSEDILKVGPVQRLSSFISERGWPPQNAVLTSKMLYFVSPESGNVLDCIPLIEISRIRALAVEPGWRSLGISQSDNSSHDPISTADKKIVVQKMAKTYPFAIHTIEQGFNGGRTYFLRVDSKPDRVAWVLHIADKARKDAEVRHGPQGGLERISAAARAFHANPACQYFWGALILLAFIVNCLQTEPGWINDPQNVSDITFTTLFTIELCINAVGNWFW